MRLAWVCAVIVAPVWAAMPAAEQNALVKKYCAVCHTDAERSGGLSLEHYDAARRDPSLAAMILSKLNNGAMGAAGNGVPDKPAQKAWLESTREQAAGANTWSVSRDGDVVSAGIVREVASRVYRLSIVCDTAAGIGQMQLTWSPQPQTGRALTASVDGKPEVEFIAEGKESASQALRKLALPEDSLTIRDVFPGETVRFPVADLDQRARSELKKCF
jgi:hypothetical protein